MKKKLFKNLVVMAMVLFVITPVFALTVNVTTASAAADFGFNYANNFDLSTTNEDPRDVAVNIVKYLMTFLGIIAVVVILYGGFIWMTAAGNEDKVAQAKKLIIAGVIGLIIIISAFVIVTFIVNTTDTLINNGSIG